MESQEVVHEQAQILKSLEKGTEGFNPEYTKAFWDDMFETEKAAFQYNYPDLYNKHEATLKGTVKAPDDGWGNFNKAWKDKYPNSDQKYIESIADTIKKSAYDQEAFADVFANDLNGPDSYALKQEYPELWQKLKDAHDAEHGVAAPPGMVHVGDNPNFSVGAVDDIDEIFASPEMQKPIDTKQELPDAWKQFTKTEAKPKFADPIAVLKKKYPELAEHYAGHSGTEMGSIESHTNDVLREWQTQISSKELEGIGARFGHEVDGLLQNALPLHDIGKAAAIKAGSKANQHKHTIPIMQDILKKQGFNEKEIALATELFNHDLLGNAVQGYGDAGQLKKQMIEKANKVGMNSADFARLQMAVYESDAASYPFITQYMKKDSSGRWTFSGHKNLAGIEALLKAKK